MICGNSSNGCMLNGEHMRKANVGVGETVGGFTSVGETLEMSLVLLSDGGAIHVAVATRVAVTSFNGGEELGVAKPIGPFFMG